MIEGWEYLGVDGELGRGKEVIRLLKEKNRAVETIKEMVEVKRLPDQVGELEDKIDGVYERLTPVEGLYRMEEGAFGSLCLPSLDVVHDLTERFDTDWCVGVGFDRADPRS